MPKNNPKLVPALARGVQVLDVISKSKKGLNVTDLAKELSIAKSTIHGICVTLSELNMLVKKPDQTFRLGPHIMRWANRFMHETDVVAEFANIWDEDSSQPGATITLSVLEGLDVVYIAARNAELSVGFDFRIGMRLPAIYTATGKAFLSYKSNAEIRRLLGNKMAAPLTMYSNQDIEALLAELAEIRVKGYAVDNQQVTEGMVCYGASVVNSHNQAIAGVAVSLQAGSVAKISEARIIENVKDIAKKISINLGAEL